jgi:hypothetical protein
MLRIARAHVPRTGPVSHPPRTLRVVMPVEQARPLSRQLPDAPESARGAGVCGSGYSVLALRPHVGSTSAAPFGQSGRLDGGSHQRLRSAVPTRSRSVDMQLERRCHVREQPA